MSILVLAALVGLGAPVQPAVDDLAAALRADPIQVLPGAPAAVDEAQVRDQLDGHYVVLAPSDSTLEAAPLADELGAEVVLVRGLRVELADWTPYLEDNLTPELLARRVNELADDVVLQTQDVTYPVLTTLRLLGGEPPGPVPDRPEHTYLEDAEVAEIVAALRRHRVHVDPAVGEPGPVWEPFPGGRPPGETGYRVAYLPPGGDPGLRYELAEAFPNDVVVVMRGYEAEAEGPGQQLDVIRAETRVRLALHPGSSMDGPYPTPPEAVRMLFAELVAERGGTLDGPDAAGLTVGTAAFAAAGAGIAVVAAGVWWWLRRRRRAAQARAFGAGSVRAADELSRLAARVPDADAAVAERYTTALGMVEQATTAAELAAAREVITEGLELAGEPVPRMREAPAPATPGRAPVGRAMRWLIAIGVLNALVTAFSRGDRRLFSYDPQATIIAAYAGALFAVVLGGYLLVRRRDGVAWRGGRWAGGVMIVCSTVSILLVYGLDDLPITLILLAEIAVVLALSRLRLAPANPSRAIVHGALWCGVITAGYGYFGSIAESSGEPELFRAAVFAGYGGFGVLAACWLYALLATRRTRDRRAAAAGVRAQALSDLLRLAGVVSTSDRSDLEELVVRYAEAKDAFESGDHERVRTLVAGALPEPVS